MESDGTRVALCTLGGKAGALQHALDFVIDQTLKFKNAGTADIHVCGYNTVDVAEEQNADDSSDEGEDEDEDEDDDLEEGEDEEDSDDVPDALPLKVNADRCMHACRALGAPHARARGGHAAPCQHGRLQACSVDGPAAAYCHDGIWNWGGGAAPHSTSMHMHLARALRPNAFPSTHPHPPHHGRSRPLRASHTMPARCVGLCAQLAVLLLLLLLMYTWTWTWAQGLKQLAAAAAARAPKNKKGAAPDSDGEAACAPGGPGTPGRGVCMGNMCTAVSARGPNEYCRQWHAYGMRLHGAWFMVLLRRAPGGYGGQV